MDLSESNERSVPLQPDIGASLTVPELNSAYFWTCPSYGSVNQPATYILKYNSDLAFVR
jgi:hypothetical protein